MADDRLGLVGLTYFFNRIKTIFASKTEFDNLKTKVDGIVETGGEPNIIESVKLNGTALVPDSEKAVDIEAAQMEPSKNAGELLGMMFKQGGFEFRIFSDGTVILTDDLATETFNIMTDAATLSVVKIPVGSGGDEILTVVEQGTDKFSFNYYKSPQGNLPSYVNMTFGDEDYFSLATTDYVNQGLAAKQDALTFDATPTEGSTNPVTSGGVFGVLQSVGNKTYVSATEPTEWKNGDTWFEEVA